MNIAFVYFGKPFMKVRVPVQLKGGVEAGLYIIIFRLNNSSHHITVV